MLKARNRKLSMLLVLAMLMTMFVGVGTASAATTYSAVTVPTFGTAETYNNTLGIIEVKLDTAIGINAGDILTVSMPSSVTINPSAPAAAVANEVYDIANALATDDVVVVVPEFLPGTSNVRNAVQHGNVNARVGRTNKSIDIEFTAGGASGTAIMYIHTRNAKVAASDDLVATVAGSNSAVFPMQTVTIGKVVSGSGTAATTQSVATLSSNGGNLDPITLVETKVGTLKAGDEIKFKLPSGFAWTGNTTIGGAIGVSPNWAFNTYTFGASATDDFTIQRSADPRLLIIKLKPNTAVAPAFNGFVSSTSLTGAGRFDLLAGIRITDDSIAKMGEVTVNISGTNVTDQDLVVAKLADYGVTIQEGTVQEVVAGWDTELDKASFKIVENIANSLLTGRTITLTLPDGAKWLTNAAGTTWPNDVTNSKPVDVVNERGNVVIQNSDGLTSTNNGRTLKLTVTGGSKSTLEFKKFQIALRADFSGDLNVEIAGNAGVEGKVKIAEVVPALTMENDGKAKIVIGTQAQTIGDLIIKENSREAIDVTQGDRVVLQLPDGASWAVKPTVEVTEGDLSLDAVSTDGRLLNLTFKSSSTKPSTIKISNIQVTTNRILPEGDFKISVVASNAAGGIVSTALTDNSALAQFNLTTIVSKVVGKVVTPAPGETVGNGEFKIGSNIYYVGGVAKVMDVAPYIKGDRTYVPMRYAAEIIGAEVVWDDAARTVTLTKGDDVVVFTIGSTTYTVNGEAKTADVAPEIANSRTMLPARYVAEAFGAVVGWDAGTQTVLIQQ